MSDRSGRRKYSGVDRRHNGGRAFNNAEEILKERARALDKLNEYEMDESVVVISFIVHSAAISSVVVAAVGMYVDHSTALWLGVAGAAVALTFGEKWIRMARKKARERFNKEYKHLASYLPS